MTHSLGDYVEEFKEPRERWVAGYFSWTEVEDVTEAELHTARDGFDAGATWMERQLKPQIEKLQKQLDELRKS